jgi:hypothetical protein
MRYYDYEWDLYPQSIVFDKELDTNNLGWQKGDLFRLIIEEDGRTLLRKVDPLIKFLEEGAKKSC